MAKECPNLDKYPEMACYKCHKLRHWSALCPYDPRASRSSTKPSLKMVQQYRSGPLQPACLSQITIMGLEPRMQLDVAGSSRISWLTQVLPILSCPPTPEPSPPKLVSFWVLQEKQLQKIYPSSSSLLGYTNIFLPVSGGP